MCESWVSYDPGSGHVHPDAGAIQIFAHGDWLIVDDGYSAKHTEYQNTVTISDIGQTGQGRSWFSSTQLLKEKRGATILRATSGSDFDYVIGDVAPAYEPAAGLTRFLRHVIYWRPDTWVLIDELATRQPARFALYFHADVPFQPGGSEMIFDVKRRNGALRLVSLAPQGVVARSFKQDIISTGGTVTRNLDTLSLSSRDNLDKALFVTVLAAHPAAADPDILASLAESGTAQILTLKRGGLTLRLSLHPDQPDPSTPMIQRID